MSTKHHFDELTKHSRIFKRITDDEEICYTVDRRRLKILIIETATTFLINSGGSPISRGAMEQRTGVRSSKYLDLETNDDKEEIFKRNRPELEEAINHFIESIGLVFADALEDLLLESVFKSLSKKTERGKYILGLTEKEFFKRLLDVRLKSQEARIGAKKASGEKMIWVLEKRQELLNFYNEKIQIIREAKKFYRMSKNLKERELTIKINFPELPDEIINDLSLSGRDGQPNQITLKYASIHFKTPQNTLEKTLSSARKDTVMVGNPNNS